MPDNKPYITYALIFSCIAVYAYEFFVSSTQGAAALDALFSSFGFSLTNVLAGKWYVLLTSAFLHAGPDHILLNMIALFFFGRALEEHVSRRNFLLIFFGAAIAGDVAITAANLLGIMPADAITVGASAGIFGVMGAAMFVKPLEFVVFPYIIPVPIVLVALLYVIYNASAFMAVILSGAKSQISYVSHLGGLAAGVYAGIKIESLKRDLIALFIIFAIIIIIPVIWSYLETFNYASMLSGLFGNA